MSPRDAIVPRLATLAATVTMAAVLACTANEGVPQPTPSGTPTSAVVGTVTIVQATAPPTELTPPPAPSGVKRLSANFATREELRAAFTNAGILNAARWAELIEEARPIPAQDVNFVALRKTLREGGAPPDVVDQIARLLTP